MVQPSPSPNRPPTASLPARTPGPPQAATGRNWLALASLLLGLPFPVVVGLFLVQAQVPSHAIQQAIGLVTTVLLVVGLPGMVAAIVTGHVALVEAKRFTPRHAWRGLAITGLALGYLSVVYAIWLVVQFFLSGSSLLE